MATNYALKSGAAELERLRLQAGVWQCEAETFLDHIGVAPGWSCIDLGCGAIGILGPLSERVGKTGRVLGVDIDAQQIAAAQDFIRQEQLTNVALLESDAYATGLPDASFDLVHVRFLFAPAGRDTQLLAEMQRLVRPGGVLAIQEPDSVAWRCVPSHPDWERLASLILAAFRSGGGDFDAGRRTYGMLRGAGLREVQLRTAVLGLPSGHHYGRLPIQLAASLRERIVEHRLIDEAELENLVVSCERIAADPDTYITTFIVTQVWGRTPTPAWETRSPA